MRHARVVDNQPVAQSAPQACTCPRPRAHPTSQMARGARGARTCLVSFLSLVLRGGAAAATAHAQQGRRALKHNARGFLGPPLFLGPAVTRPAPARPRAGRAHSIFTGPSCNRPWTWRPVRWCWSRQRTACRVGAGWRWWRPWTSCLWCTGRSWHLRSRGGSLRWVQCKGRTLVVKAGIGVVCVCVSDARHISSDVQPTWA